MFANLGFPWEGMLPGLGSKDGVSWPYLVQGGKRLEVLEQKNNDIRLAVWTSCRDVLKM